MAPRRTSWFTYAQNLWTYARNLWNGILRAFLYSTWYLPVNTSPSLEPSFDANESTMGAVILHKLDILVETIDYIEDLHSKLEHCEKLLGYKPNYPAPPILDTPEPNIGGKQILNETDVAARALLAFRR